jgi:hypothetical protein
MGVDLGLRPDERMGQAADDAGRRVEVRSRLSPPRVCRSASDDHVLVRDPRQVTAHRIFGRSSDSYWLEERGRDPHLKICCRGSNA